MSDTPRHPMRTLGSLALVLGVGIALGVGWSNWRMSRTATGDGSMAAAPMISMANPKRRVLYWHDPMKPEVKFDKPGKSPFMDMQLQPVYADEGEGADSREPGVRVSTTARQQLGIRLGRVERAAVAPEINAVGIVAYDEAAQAVVQPRADGYVTRLMVRAALDSVRQGQVLAEVDIPAWREALGEYLALLPAQPAAEQPATSGVADQSTAPPEAASAIALRTALRHRLVVLGVPVASIQQVEQSHALPAHFELNAPVSGVVTELGIREGAAFMAGTMVARISRIDSVWVDAQLPEAQARSVPPGQRVRITASAHPGKVFAGKVLRVLPQLDAVTRTVGVRILVDNTAGRLSPGMYVNAALPGGAAQAQLWVPSEAVITTGERSVVIVARDGGGFDVASVTAGIESGGKTAILSGLREGQSVVLSGQFLIDSEANLKSAFNRLTAGGANP